MVQIVCAGVDLKQSNLLNNWVYEHVFIHLKAKLSENTVKWPKSCRLI